MFGGMLSRLGIGPKPPTTAPRPDSPFQIERALGWIVGAMIGGIVVLAAQAIAARPPIDGWRFFTLGVLAALVAAAVGAAIGLLFGLPLSRGPLAVTVPGATAPSDKSSPAAAPLSSPADREIWFSENNSLERIAEWLTLAIVTLTLAQWRELTATFDRLATAVTSAMTAPVAVTASGAVRIATDADKVAGGVILAAYLILGFLLAYLWARRYLGEEFAHGRGRMLGAQRQYEEKQIADSSAMGMMQIAPKSSSAGPTAELQFASALHATKDDAGPDGFPSPIAPGPVAIDPWKGQFGYPINDKVEVAAEVTALETRRDLFSIRLTVHGLDESERKALAGRPLRLYLHPTFVDPIRMLHFDSRGRVSLPLISYGSFTVGVQLDDGRTLELDLAMVQGAPQSFKER